MRAGSHGAVATRRQGNYRNYPAAVRAVWLTPVGAPCVEPAVLPICSEACTPADRDTYVLRAHSCSCTRRLRNPPSLVTALLKFTSSLHGVDDQTVREVYSPRTAHKRAWLGDYQGYARVHERPNPVIWAGLFVQLATDK